MARSVSTKLLDFLVCPLSKEPLRFCPKSKNLFNDSLGISYPVIDGIPCLVPVDGQLLNTKDASDNVSSSDDVNRIVEGKT